MALPPADLLPTSSEVLEALKLDRVYDHMRLADNSQLQNLFKKELKKNDMQMEIEHLNFSASVTKINRHGKLQERALVMTNRAIYNFKKHKYSSCKRRIPIQVLSGLVLSRQSTEVVFQIGDDYDYRYMIENRIGVCEVLSKHYQRLVRKNLPVYLAPEGELTNYVMTKEEWRHVSPEVKQKKRTDMMNNEVTLYKNSFPKNVERKSAVLKLKEKLQGASNKRVSVLTKINLSRTDSESDRVTLSGWLTRLRSSSGQWAMSYVVINGLAIDFFKARIKGTFVTLGCPCELSLNRVAQTGYHKRSSSEVSSKMPHFGRRKTSESQPGFILSIDSPDRKQPLILGTDNKEEIEEWFNVFRLSSIGDEVRRQGWILKQDPSSRSWRRRYIVLIDSRCWYHEMSYHKEISLMEPDMTVYAIDKGPTLNRQNSIGILSVSQFQFRFVIKDAKGEHLFAADTIEQRNDWIGGISKSIEEAEHEKSAPNSLESQKISQTVKISSKFFESLNQVAPLDMVALVFSDVQGSTNLWDNVPDAMDEALEMHDMIMRRTLSESNGYEVKTEGDAFMVSFFSVFEAILWCVRVQRAMLGCDWPRQILSQIDGSEQLDDEGRVIFRGLRVRMGIHWGRVNCRRNPTTKRMDYFGPAVNLAARVSDSANGGQIVVSNAAQVVISEALESKEHTDVLNEVSLRQIPGQFVFKGIRKPQEIYQLMPVGLESRNDVLPQLRAKLVDPDTDINDAALFDGELLSDWESTGSSVNRTMSIVMPSAHDSENVVCATVDEVIEYDTEETVSLEGYKISV